MELDELFLIKEIESIEDLEVFERLQEAGEIIKITVLDSIIFNDEGYFSKATK